MSKQLSKPGALVPYLDDVGKHITVNAGSQRWQVPTDWFLDNMREMVDGLQEWKRIAGPKEAAVYTALKGAVNLALPLLRGWFNNSRLFPDMPARERHSDPVVFLLGYVQAASIYVLTKGEFTLSADDPDNTELVTGVEWSHLEQLKAEIEAERRATETPAIDAASAEEGQP